MAKRLVAKTVPEEPFDDEKYMKWTMTAEAEVLTNKVDSIMTRAKTPFDGMCAGLKFLGITPSFEVISTILLVIDHTGKFLAREERITRKQLRQMGVKVGRR